MFLFVFITDLVP